MERAVVTIREMKEQASLTPEQDPVIDLQTKAATLEAQTGDQARAALLDTANMIRTLRIVPDGKEFIVTAIAPRTGF